MIRKRRKQNRKLPEKGRTARRARRFGLSLLSVVFLGLLGYGIRLLFDPDILPIQQVVVTGDLNHVSRDEVLGTVAPHVRNGFFKLDVLAVKETVVSHPWVNDASVRRIWPDRLKIKVTEEVPFARWRKGGLVNARGEIFTPPRGSYPEGLPELHGPDQTARLLSERYSEMNELLIPAGLSISRLELDDRRSWRVELTNGIELMLGRAGNRKILTRFIRTYQRMLAADVLHIRRVDLRYTNGFALRWNPAVKPANQEQPGGGSDNAEKS